jgi:ribonuclease HI
MRKVTLAELNQLALQAKNNLWDQAQSIDRDVKLYLHWSAGHYGQFFDEYHINIDQDGSIYVSTDNLAVVKSHTYKRNTGAIGIALACCYNATTNNLGPEPPTSAQIESMAQVVAVLSKALDLTIDSYRVMTHAEAANNLDGLNPNYEDNGYPDGKYGPEFSCERWDLWLLKTGDVPGSGGNIIRGKGIWYQQQGGL